MLQANSFEVAKTLDKDHEDFSLIDISFISNSPVVDSKLSRAAIIGNFPPRQCGLATFTRDMYACLSKALPKARWSVVAMNDPGASYDYPSEVTHQLPQNEIAGYRALADELNSNGTEVLFVQHEFGIYGGASGAYLINLLERVRMPIVTTLHTVLETPNDEQRRVMQDLIRLSSTLVTMARKGSDILQAVYGVPESQIAVIPHGAPSRPLRDTAEYKSLLNLAGRKTLTTFGLLSPNKGIETVIAALPAIREACPEVMYLVIGATHPHLLRNEGEKYRDGLKAMAADLGVEGNIRFINRFINDNDLIDILQASDVYVTPYLTETQITSGTLSYALALGRPIVSTPYWHAQEVLANGVGTLCPFNDTACFTKAISDLLTSDKKRAAMSSRAYMAGLSSRWSAVAHAYVARAETDVHERAIAPVDKPAPLGNAPSWAAIERMTDDCGIFQHGKYRLPDRQHGYCSDDVCRALSLVARQSTVTELTPRQVELAYRYAAFMNHAWNNDSRFRNFMSYGREWLDDGGSDDCCARSFESLIDVARSDLPSDLRSWAGELSQRVLPSTPLWNATRSQAILIKALNRAFGVVGDGQVIQGMIRRMGSDMHTLFKINSREKHVWFEPGLSYDNARLSEGLILAGHFLADKNMLRDGVSSLRWLMQKQTVRGQFAPVATCLFAEGQSREDGHPLFDQQPIEVLATIDACLTAYRVTGDGFWKNEATRAFAWFHGDNCLNIPLISDDGGCFDGLTPNGVNENQGAESILAYPLSWVAMKAGL